MSDSSADADLHENWLLERVVGAAQSGVRTLHGLIATAGGADPAAVRDALGRAVSRGLLGKAAMALAGTGCGHGHDEVVEPSLPPAHPLDFEWRFSRRGAEHLLSKVAEHGSGDLCFLASTTVALLAASRGWKGRVVSIDANRLVLEHAHRVRPEIETAHLDVTRDTLPQLQANVVVADPPWYPEYMPGFLWASARLCVAGGHVLLSVPGEGTRPGIAADRETMLREAALYGLKVVEFEPQAVAYETPLFERNALRAAGITFPVGFWRRADLAVFRRTAALEGARPAPPPEQGTWAEFSADGTRIRFRRTTGRAGCFPQLVSIVPGDVLPTVSRRDPRRVQADVWTSGNRVYACESPDILYAVAGAAGRRSSADETVEAFLGRKLYAAEARSVSKAFDQVIKLIRTEGDEQTAYVRELEGGKIHVA